MDFIMTIVEQGLIYGILTLGIYITYKILDFPDLTVDGSFPLGVAVTAALITRGVNPYLTIPIAFLVGVLAGICTGLIHVKCKVRDLLSGIIMMTALYTVNLKIAGTNNVPLFSQETMFKNGMPLRRNDSGIHEDRSDLTCCSDRKIPAGFLFADQIRVSAACSRR